MSGSTPSINTHILLGRVSSAPDLRYTQAGAAKLSFLMKTERPQPDGRIFHDSHKVVVWGKTAEGQGRHLHEGDVVSITGRVGTRKWEKNDGSVVWITETTAVTMAAYPAAAPAQSSFPQPGAPAPPPLFDEEEEIPF